MMIWLYGVDSKKKGSSYVEKIEICLEYKKEMVRALQLEKSSYSKKCADLKDEIHAGFLEILSYLERSEEELQKKVRMLEEALVEKYSRYEREIERDQEEISLLKEDLDGLLKANYSQTPTKQEMHLFTDLLDQIDLITKAKRYSSPQGSNMDDLYAIIREKDQLLQDFLVFFQSNKSKGCILIYSN